MTSKERFCEGDVNLGACDCSIDDENYCDTCGTWTPTPKDVRNHLCPEGFMHPEVLAVLKNKDFMDDVRRGIESEARGELTPISKLRRKYCTQCKHPLVDLSEGSESCDGSVYKCGCYCWEYFGGKTPPAKYCDCNDREGIVASFGHKFSCSEYVPGALRIKDDPDGPVLDLSCDCTYGGRNNRPHNYDCPQYKPQVTYFGGCDVCDCDGCDKDCCSDCSATGFCECEKLCCANQPVKPFNPNGCSFCGKDVPVGIAHGCRGFGGRRLNRRGLPDYAERFNDA